MLSEPPQGSVISQPHLHAYEYTSGGKYVVRHCECGKSWVLVVLENIIWREIEEDA